MSDGTGARPPRATDVRANLLLRSEYTIVPAGLRSPIALCSAVAAIEAFIRESMDEPGTAAGSG
jgi:hypothetical protein